MSPNLAPPAHGSDLTTVDRLAVASLVLSVLGSLVVLPAIAGVVLGVIARGRIARSGGERSGAALALAGIAVGAVVTLLWIILAVFTVVAIHHCHQIGNCSQTNAN